MPKNTTVASECNQKFYLYLNGQGSAILRGPDQKERTIPDTPFHRWWLRFSVKTMTASAPAKAWFFQKYPRTSNPTPGMVFAPKDYQQLSLTRMEINNCCLWLDMGLGKSFLALAFCLRQFYLKKQNRFLIVCPVSVFATWYDQVAEHIKPDVKAKIVLAHGPKKKKALQALRFSPTSAPVFVLTSYETLGAILEDLGKIELSAVFFDESSKIKNPKSNRTKAAFKLLAQYPGIHAFPMSGTPSTTTPLGFFPQYEIIGKGRSGSPDYFTFSQTYTKSCRFARILLPNGRQSHCKAGTPQDLNGWLHTHRPSNSSPSFSELGYRFSRDRGPKTILVLNYYNKIYGVKNIEKLNQITTLNAITIKKEEVLADLPEKSYVTRTIKLSKEQADAYRDMTENNFSSVNNKVVRFSYKTPAFVKLHQIANGFIVSDTKKVTYFKNNPKLQELEQILEESGTQKLVVWCAYRAQIAQCSAFLKKLNVPARECHGGIPVSERIGLMAAFRKPDAPRVLIANPEVGGMGLNMTWATVEVFMSNWHKPDTRLQAEDRLHRIGQKNAVTVIDLTAEKTMENYLLGNLQKRIDVEDQIITMAQLKGEA